MIIRCICLTIAVALFVIAFLIVLVGGHDYTVSHIRELNDAGLAFFALSFFPWKH